jgi:uncharacterized protein
MKHLLLFLLLATSVHAQNNQSPRAKIVVAARAQVGDVYDASYVKLAYPNGDVPKGRGACTDVVIRALRAVGYDLQKLMHEDMKRNFALYPSRKKWGLTRTDKNIDHRRVLNQMVFYRRFGKELTKEVSTRTLPQWQPGDIVCWNLNAAGMTHIGIISDKKDASGLPLVIHNLGGCREENVLTAWQIIGHFRYPR